MSLCITARAAPTVREPFSLLHRCPWAALKGWAASPLEYPTRNPKPHHRQTWRQAPQLLQPPCPLLQSEITIMVVLKGCPGIVSIQDLAHSTHSINAVTADLRFLHSVD